MEKVFLSLAQIQAILQFLSRSQISGAEAMILMDCVQALQKILDNGSQQATADTAD